MLEIALKLIQSTKLKHDAKKQCQKKIVESWSWKPILHQEYLCRSFRNPPLAKVFRTWRWDWKVYSWCQLARNYQVNNLHNITDSRFKFCDEYIEVIDHLSIGFSIFTLSEYKKTLLREKTAKKMNVIWIWGTCYHPLGLFYQHRLNNTKTDY